MKHEVIEFSVAEVREEMRLLYNDWCRIDWCRTKQGLTPEEKKQTKTPTLEHIIPRKKGGSDHLSNLTYTVEYCNSKKGHDISDHILIAKLLQEAQNNTLAVMKRLLQKRIALTGTNKGYYVVRILTVIYEVKVTKKGNVCILRDRFLTKKEQELIKKRDKDLYTSP